MTQSDARLTELADMIKNGRLDGFDELYGLTEKSVFFAGLAIVHDKELTADLMQETYYDFLMNIRNIRSDGNIRAYLCRAIHNKAVNEALKRKREESLEALSEQNMQFGAEETHEDSSLFALARRILSQEEYQIVIMHAVSELKFRQIARILNKPIGTVLWKYNKAIKCLREKAGDQV